MITQPLRDEHKELLPHVEQLKVVADSIGSTGNEAIHQGIRKVEEFLLHHLIPHAKAEDRILYPEVERVLGVEKATATMSRDHEEVGKLTEELTALKGKLAKKSVTEIQTKQLRRILYGLYALVQLHFNKEEEIYLPLLDARLNQKEGQALFASMDAVAADIKRG
jgi:hemerythrin-like domain-containing protein